MTTADTIRSYFDRLQERRDWESLLAEDLDFTNFTDPVKRVHGRSAFLLATSRFYSMIAAVELRHLFIDGNRACASTHYELQPPQGSPAFGSDVAEVFSVKDGRIESFAIYFDSAPYPQSNPALAVARAYHRAWASEDFAAAAALLAADLRVEVPLNDYPTKDSFATALADFGGSADGVDLLAEFGRGDQAMLLYDVRVAPLGTLRVAEHFTVAGGEIRSLRQVHDTAALRAGGFAHGA